MNHHDWLEIDSDDGEWCLEVCIYCGAERAQDFINGREEITLHGAIIGHECSTAPPDDEPDFDYFEPTDAQLADLPIAADDDGATS